MSLREQTIRGIAWTTLASVLRQGVGLVVMVGLARVLDPSDFGLVAMVSVLVAFVALVPRLGLGPALVQAPELDEAQTSSAFWLCLLCGAVLGAAVTLAAPWVGAFYADPRLVSITRWLAWGLLLESAAVVPVARLERAMDFRRLAGVESAAVAGGGVAGLTAAIGGWGVHALVLQLLVAAGIRSLGVFHAARWRPQRTLRPTCLAPLLRFGRGLLGFQVFNYWTRNADTFLIGRFVGALPLGHYAMAYRLMMLPMQQVTQVFHRVMFPALSRVQHDRVRVKSVYLRATRMIGLVTIPVACGLFVVAEPLVDVLLGAGWEPVAPLLQVLSLVAVKQPIGATTGWLYQSQGRTDLMLRWGLCVGVLTLLGFAIGLHWGVLGVAVSYAVTQYLVWIPAIRIPGRLIGLGFGEFLRNVGGIFGCSFAMSAVVWALGHGMPAQTPIALVLAIQVSAGIASYMALAHFSGLEAWRDARELLAERREALAPRAVPVASVR